MICKFCGKEIEEGSTICNHCAKPVIESFQSQGQTQNNNQDNPIKEAKNKNVIKEINETEFNELKQNNRKVLYFSIGAIATFIITFFLTGIVGNVIENPKIVDFVLKFGWGISIVFLVMAFANNNKKQKYRVKMQDGTTQEIQTHKNPVPYVIGGLMGTIGIVFFIIVALLLIFIIYVMVVFVKSAP